jgi:hypothetical protein
MPDPTNPQFSPHAVHQTMGMGRRLHTRRPFINLKEMDAAAAAENELRKALNLHATAKARLEVEPDNADFQKGERLMDVEVQAATRTAKLLNSTKVDTILAEHEKALAEASKPAKKATKAVAVQPPTTGKESAPGGQGGGKEPPLDVQAKGDTAKLLALAPNEAIKKGLEAILAKDVPDAVKLPEMRKLLKDAGVPL